MKKLALLFLLVTLIAALAACGETKSLHCDNCNTEVTVEADSNMTESWIVYCESCNEELFADHSILGNN